MVLLYIYIILDRVALRTMITSTRGHVVMVSCAIYTHTPARKSSTNFQLYYFVIQNCSTNWLGHGHGGLAALRLLYSIMIIIA